MVAAETFARTILVTINRVVFVEMSDNVNDYTALIKEGTIILQQTLVRPLLSIKHASYFAMLSRVQRSNEESYVQLNALNRENAMLMSLYLTLKCLVPSYMR
jgi:hypothetical protein